MLPGNRYTLDESGTRESGYNLCFNNPRCGWGETVNSRGKMRYNAHGDVSQTVSSGIRTKSTDGPYYFRLNNINISQVDGTSTVILGSTIDKSSTNSLDACEKKCSEVNYVHPTGKTYTGCSYYTFDGNHCTTYSPNKDMLGLSTRRHFSITKPSGIKPTRDVVFLVKGKNDGGIAEYGVVVYYFVMGTREKLVENQTPISGSYSSKKIPVPDGATEFIIDYKRPTDGGKLTINGGKMVFNGKNYHIYC